MYHSCSHIQRLHGMDTSRVAWIEETWDRFYLMAQDDGVTGDSRLYFDTRCWEKKEVKRFFQDLCFADVETYDKIAKRHNRHGHVKTVSAQRRYVKWETAKLLSHAKEAYTVTG